jgi:hypothetical protein
MKRAYYNGFHQPYKGKNQGRIERGILGL